MLSADTAQHSDSDKILLIAGGSGITPIHALAEEFVAAGRDIILLYGNRNQSGVVFEKELEILDGSSAGCLCVVQVMSDDPAWTGEQGRIDGERWPGLCRMRALAMSIFADLRS